HIGKKLRFVLARLFKLPTLVLDFIEQPHVLDGDHRLVGEGGGQLNLLRGERSRCGAAYYQHTDCSALAHEGDTENGAVLPRFLALDEFIFGVIQDVGNMNGLAFEHNAAGDGAAPRGHWTALQKLLEIRAISVGRDMIEGRANLPRD